MKAVFKIIGKSETKTTITVEIDSPKHVLTRNEVIRYRENIKNGIHRLLREQLYDVSEITISKKSRKP